MESDVVFIDIKTCGLTLNQLMSEIVRLQEEHPDLDVFMDGDRYAIIGRRKRV